MHIPCLPSRPWAFLFVFVIQFFPLCFVLISSLPRYLPYFTRSPLHLPHVVPLLFLVYMYVPHLRLLSYDCTYFGPACTLHIPAIIYSRSCLANLIPILKYLLSYRLSDCCGLLTLPRGVLNKLYQCLSVFLRLHTNVLHSFYGISPAIIVPSCCDLTKLITWMRFVHASQTCTGLIYSSDSVYMHLS